MADSINDIMRRTPRKSLSRFTVASNVLYDELRKEQFLMQSHNRLPVHSNDFETKKQRSQLLKKKTIHGSLENLSKVGYDYKTEWKHSHSSAHPDSLANQMVTTPRLTIRNFDGQNPVLDYNIPPTPAPRIRQNTIVGTSDIITMTEVISEMNIKENGGGDYLTITPGTHHQYNILANNDSHSTDDQNYQTHITEKASEEHSSLSATLKEQKKRSILYKTLYVIVFKALKKRSFQLLETEKMLRQRREECAARIILHHLLLNSWKTTKGQVTAVTCENTQMHKTIDNQNLQLSIIRKMQAIEKEKTTVVLRDYNEVKMKYHQAVQDNQAIKEEYAKVLSEKRGLERHLEILRDEHSQLSVDLRIKLDKKEMLLRSMEMDRLRAEKFSLENEKLLKEADKNKTKIDELAAEQARWQEKAMQCESLCTQLKLEFQEKLETFEKAVKDNEDFTKQREILELSKNKLEKEVDEAKAKLQESIKQKEKIESAYTECREELDDLEDQVQYLQITLKKYKKENAEIRQKLYNCTLRNVQKRRMWGSALYFLVNPIEAFKRLYFGSSEMERQRQQVPKNEEVTTS